MNLGQLQAISEKYNVDTIDIATLQKLGIIKKTDQVKVLGTGELTAKLTVTAHACSAAAKAAVEAQGGSVTIL